MADYCTKGTHQSNKYKQSINNLKSSIFCGVKGFLTFNLALLSYLEYGLKQKSVANQCKVSKKAYEYLKKGTVFTMKRNIIPFLEMVVIVPFVCFGLPAIIGKVSLIQCALVCAVLMVTTCFIVRTFNLREKLLEKTTDYCRSAINKEFSKDSIVYPIFDGENKNIKYASPDTDKLTSESDCSYFSKFLTFPLKILQSCILLSLAAVEIAETIPSLVADVFCDRSFNSIKSNLQRSGHLLYASARNLVSPMSKFDECVAEFIGNPKVACCGV